MGILSTDQMVRKVLLTTPCNNGMCAEDFLGGVVLTQKFVIISDDTTDSYVNGMKIEDRGIRSSFVVDLSEGRRALSLSTELMRRLAEEMVRCG